jgi:hypothetical protein
MKRVLSLSLIVLVILATVGAKEKKSSISGQILNARFVYVTNFPGAGQHQIYDPKTYPEDRQAITDTEKAIRAWGRWKTLESAYQADLIISVRRGRRASARGGVNIGTGPIVIGGGEQRRNPGEVGTVAQAEAGPAEDMIAIFAPGVNEKSNPYGAIDYDAPPLWRLIQANALQSPSLPGFQQLRKEIEKADAENTKKNR